MPAISIKRSVVVALFGSNFEFHLVWSLHLAVPKRRSLRSNAAGRKKTSKALPRIMLATLLRMCSLFPSVFRSRFIVLTSFKRISRCGWSLTADFRAMTFGCHQSASQPYSPHNTRVIVPLNYILRTHNSGTDREELSPRRCKRKNLCQSPWPRLTMVGCTYPLVDLDRLPRESRLG